MTDFGGVTSLEIGGRGFTLAVERSITIVNRKALIRYHIIDELIVIVYIRDFSRMRTDWLAKTLVTVT